MLQDQLSDLVSNNRGLCKNLNYNYYLKVLRNKTPKN